MAVERKNTSMASEASAGRRLRVGTNVAISIILVVAIIVVAQVIGFKMHARADMTSSRVNSLSEATENLVRDLEQNVRLTSLYFETDREKEDQPRYRQAARDLLELYEATNRSKVTAQWVNPLKDHQEFKALVKRLEEKNAFAEELDAYKEGIKRYQNELNEQMAGLVESELSQIAALGSETFGGQRAQSPLAPIELRLNEWSAVLSKTHERVNTLAEAEMPQYTGLIAELKDLYRQFAKLLGNIGDFGEEQGARSAGLNPQKLEFLKGARERYSQVKEAIEAERERLDELDPLEFEKVMDQLRPTSNAILVETEEDARVVDFSSVWPPVRQGPSVRQMGFKDRAFKGEEKLTAAILRATHKQQTAAVFVRYGGSPLFFGGFMPNQPRPLYAAMKEQLEDANFIVEEWDLKTKDTPPEIDPAPTRTIYVVLKPNPPEPGPMGQPSREPPFGEKERRAILDAIGENGRALFVAGWVPGSAMPGLLMPSPYEYHDYLKETWGVSVDAKTLLIQATSAAPGRYIFSRDPVWMNKFEPSSHPIVSGAASLLVRLPSCAPLELAETPPEGVTFWPLLSIPACDGLWGAQDIQKYIEQAAGDSVTKVAGDLEGPFVVAVAAEKGDAKMVVVGSQQFAIDDIAFAPEFAMTPEGFTVRSRNPGNVTLLINSLHWLNDNTEFMNIGQPIDAAVLSIEKESTVTAVQAITILVWPALALCCGGVVWWVRRR
jgi:hypothetical protein